MLAVVVWVRQVARVEARGVMGFRGSRMRKGMRSCVSFCRRYVAGRVREFLDLLATARKSLRAFFVKVDHLNVRYAADRRAGFYPRMVQSQAQWIAGEQQQR